ncbi:hypothetical protein BDF22DRAFT_668814 [Syncephalis plumigaleata]|nr:hypothetical protein BDF22DRAFT_668814 [Syncephalis plumigaleata]
MPSITSLDIRSQFGNAITMLKLKVYTRGDYKLRYTANLPSDDQSELTNSRILVWDLERIKGHTKKLAATSYAACLYETTHEYATIYVARINEHQRNQVDWSLYQVRHDTPIRRLQKGSFNVDVPLRSLSITAQEYPHIKLYVSTSHHGCIRYIHTVTLNKDLTIERDRVQRLAHQVVSIPNSYDGTNKIFYRLLEEQEGELQIDWSTICQYRHIIGSLFVIQQWKDDHRHYYLVDVKTGEIIRRIDGNEACCMPHFLMTGYIIRDCRTSNAKITSYAAL